MPAGAGITVPTLTRLQGCPTRDVPRGTSEPWVAARCGGASRVGLRRSTWNIARDSRSAATTRIEIRDGLSPGAWNEENFHGPQRMQERRRCPHSLNRRVASEQHSASAGSGASSMGRQRDNAHSTAQRPSISRCARPTFGGTRTTWVSLTRDHRRRLLGALRCSTWNHAGTGRRRRRRHDSSRASSAWSPTSRRSVPGGGADEHPPRRREQLRRNRHRRAGVDEAPRRDEVDPQARARSTSRTSIVCTCTRSSRLESGHAEAEQIGPRRPPLDQMDDRASGDGTAMTSAGSPPPDPRSTPSPCLRRARAVTKRSACAIASAIDCVPIAAPALDLRRGRRSRGHRQASAGAMTTRRCGSSPSDRVATPSTSRRARRGSPCGRPTTSARGRAGVPVSTTSAATCVANRASASRRRSR